MTGVAGGPDVLLVCRANRARSPLVAQILTEWAAERAGGSPYISSCGLHATPGASLLPVAGRVLAAHGWEIPVHRARRFELAEARTARIVITFERELLKGIVRRDPALLPRCFTLREVGRLAGSPLWEDTWNGTRDVAIRLHRLRPRVAAGDDDSPDPVGARRRAARLALEGVLTDTLEVAPVLLPARRKFGQSVDALP